jgi:hypothetical protein
MLSMEFYQWCHEADTFQVWVENRDFVEKKPTMAKNHFLTLLTFYQSKLWIPWERSLHVWAKERIYYATAITNRLVLLGFVRACSRLLVYLSRSSNRVSLFLFIVNGGEWAQKVSYLIHIWLILGCGSPIGKMGQSIFCENSTLFILNQELYIKNTYPGTKSFNIMIDWSSWSWWTSACLVIQC